MPLSKGDRVGPYEILGLVGQGGMGEVYRAHDDRLRRDVAIKVSNAQFTARFTSEARAIAALNHTNICHLYDVGPNYLVMEYVEGEDLKGPLDLDDALPVIQQLIDGIEAAHEKNIVHRDLKPANIKITPEGVVKILDFGLAKAMDRSSPDGSDPGNSPTLTGGATAVGTILGTAAYMAPEQAKGKSADKRSDIWSFGVILYEVLTGRKLFAGETAMEVLGGVLNQEPDIAAAPARMHKLLRWCLEKDRKQRLASISDARRLLNEANETESAVQLALPRRSRFGSLPWIAAGIFALISAAAGFGWWRGTQHLEQPVVRLDVDLGSDVSLAMPGGNSTVIISPDGTRLAYVASVAGGSGLPRIFIRRLDQPKSVELPGTQGANAPFFSPDSQWVGFTLAAKLYKILVDGGPPTLLGDTGPSTGSTWGEDGNITTGVLLKGLLKTPSAGGTTVPTLNLANGEFTFIAPQILPGGKAILYAVYPGARNDPDRARIEVFSVADHSRTVVAQGGISARYLATANKSGYVIYANRNTLFAVPFNVNNPGKTSTAVPVLNDVSFHPSTFEAQFDVSPTGTAVYRKAGLGSMVALTTIAWVDAAGNKRPLVSKAGAYRKVRLSPEGKRLAVELSGGGGQVEDIEVYDLQRETWTPLMVDQRASISPVWTPDGQFILFGSLTGSYWARADGASQPQSLSLKQSIQEPASTTPDGKRLAYSEGGEGAAQIWTLSLENSGGQFKAGKPEQFLKSTGSQTDPTFSPDGKWLAYGSNSSGAEEVYVRAFPDNGDLRKISNNGGGNPIWSRAGNELLCQAGDREMAVSYSTKGGTFVPEKPRVWVAKVGGTANDLSPDGKLLLVLAPVDPSDAAKAEHEIVLIQNFPAYLRQKMPADK
jgi:serine/threonine protein kinase